MIEVNPVETYLILLEEVAHQRGAVEVAHTSDSETESCRRRRGSVLERFHYTEAVVTDSAHKVATATPGCKQRIVAGFLLLAHGGTSGDSDTLAIAAHRLLPIASSSGTDSATTTRSASVTSASGHQGLIFANGHELTQFFLHDAGAHPIRRT